MAGDFLPHVKLTCPLSHQVIDGCVVEPHAMMATRCKGDKGIFLRCPLHLIQAFLNHPILVTRYLNGQEAKVKRPGARIVEP